MFITVFHNSVLDPNFLFCFTYNPVLYNYVIHLFSVIVPIIYCAISCCYLLCHVLLFYYHEFSFGNTSTYDAFGISGIFSEFDIYSVQKFQSYFFLL